MKEGSEKNKHVMNELDKLRRRLKEMERLEARRREREEELRKSEEKLKIIIENVRDVIFQLSPKGFIEYVSPNVKELYGYKPEELIGKHLKKTTPMNQVPKALETLRTVLSGKTIKNFEIGQKNSEGQIVPVEINLAPVKKGGKVIAVQGVMRDISEQKQAEEKLRESEERLRNVFEYASDGIFVLDLNGVYTQVNKRVLEMFGLRSRDEILGKNAFTLVAPSDVEKAKEGMKIVFKKGSIVRQEYVALKADGTEFLIEVSGTLLKDASDNPVGIIGISRDITERKKAEEKLRESERRLSSFMDSATESFVLYDKELNIVEANKRAVEGTGLKKKELIGKNLLDLVPELIKTERYEKYVNVIKTGKPYFIDDLVPHPKYGNVHVALEAFKVGDGLGVIASDITRQKQVEGQLKKTLEELKQRNQELDEYTYTVSHELKTPLIAIQGFSAILYKKCKNKLNKNMAQYLNRITQASERLERMVSDLLKLSRSGRKTGKLKKVDINSVVETSLRHFESLIKEKHIDVKRAPEFPTITCDRLRIIEVFDNLIANAIRFAGSQEKPKIKIGWNKLKKFYRFWVEDNGLGIIDEDKKNIFKVFVQGSLVSSEDGTGVGLSIAKKVIESHGGKIWVKSEPGAGATFYFTIPV